VEPDVKTLFLTSRPITAMRSGYDLRVAHLLCESPGERHLAAIRLQPDYPGPDTIDLADACRSIHVLPGPEPSRRGWRRHLRLDEDDYLRLACRPFFERTLQALRRIVADEGITHIAAFGRDVAEFARRLDGCFVLFDVCDSVALTKRRALDNATGATAAARLKARLELERWRRTEGRLPASFDVVTTINQADTDEIRALHRRPADNVHTIPNGIEQSLVRPLARGPLRRGAAFWGNLDFAPNAVAMDFYVNQVHLPLLAPLGVELCIVGADAPAWLKSVAEREPTIRPLGFVDDLPGAVAEYPVMVNPMRVGSGMKNKVIEAFGLGLTVVSTRLGMESLPEARDGEHYLEAEDAAAFARQVLAAIDAQPGTEVLRRRAQQLVSERYLWSAVGRRWRQLLAPHTALCEEESVWASKY
jgi:glycosyltransferase involved in cell wall biosynthesis